MNWQEPGPQPLGKQEARGLGLRLTRLLALLWVLLYVLVPVPTFCPLQHGDLSCFMTFTKLKGQGGTLEEPDPEPTEGYLLGWLASSSGAVGTPSWFVSRTLLCPN